MFARRQYAALAFAAAVATTAIAIGLAQAPARAGIRSGSTPANAGFRCSPPPGINLPATTNSVESMQGGDISIQCYWTYKAGTVPVGGLAGFPCSYNGVPLPSSTAYFGRTSGNESCSN